MSSKQSLENAKIHTPRSSQSTTRSLSPTGASSTYGDLYNATPTPRNRRLAEDPHVDSPLRALHASTPTRSVTGRLQNLDLMEGEGPSNEHGGGNQIPPTVSVEDNHRFETSIEHEQDNENGPFYNLRQERLPRAPIYNSHLQRALRDVRNQFTELQRAIAGCPLLQNQGTDLSELYAQLQNLSQYEYPESRTVGFIGDSGVGKSSVINSILDQESLARSSGDGAACTCVVTEFRTVDTNHPQPFTIEADFMSEDETQELLEELVRSFRRGYTAAIWEVSDVQERQQTMDIANSSWEALDSLFRNQPGLTREFLSDESNTESVILGRLKEWAMAVIASRAGAADTFRFSVIANDLVECKSQLDALTTTPAEGQSPAIWPFIKLIRVYLRSPVLRTGLILADLPGFRDLNFARVRATERYLRNSCDEVFIVTGISRCTTDQSIPDIIRRCDREQPMRVICTGSEDMSADETRRDCPARVAETIRRFQGQTQNLRARINTTRSRRRMETGEQRERYAEEETRLCDDLEDIEFRLLEFMIRWRNGKVTAALRQKYTDTVNIFCVSNRLYSDHRQDSPDRAEAYIELSGIRALRRYCQSVPAEAQLRSISSFLKHQAPAFLGSLNQWALTGFDTVTADRAQTLRQVLQESQSLLEQTHISRQSTIHRLQEDLNLQFNTLITNTSRGNRRRWKDSAIQASQKWRGWHHGTYAAFCRHYGTHQTEAVGSRCWNDEILQLMREELQERWDSIEDWIETQNNVLQETTEHAFQRACGIIQEHVGLAPQALANLLDNMESSQGCIIDVMDNSLSELIKNTMTIKLDSLEGHDSSYIASLMRPAYGSCNQESGRGSDKRRKDIMYRHLAHPTRPIFMNLCEQLSRNHSEMVNEICEDLLRGVREEIRKIDRDLRTVVADDGQVTEAEQFPEFSQNLRERVGEIRRLLGRARRVLEEVSTIAV